MGTIERFLRWLESSSKSARVRIQKRKHGINVERAIRAAKRQKGFVHFASVLTHAHPSIKHGGTHHIPQGEQ